MAGTGDAVAIVSTDQADAFNAGIADAHIAVESLGTVEGFNYAKGKRVALTIYRRAQS